MDLQNSMKNQQKAFLQSIDFKKGDFLIEFHLHLNHHYFSFNYP